ncbi:MAG: apolipoprotein N-acyltransferase [Bacteroidetes bacterium]|nr:apolipoprotein N-acyltransferase [Bacteroidota bacterium]
MLRLLAYSLLSALLLSFAWPINGFTLLIFVAWIPLLSVENTLSKQNKGGLKLLGFSYLTFLLWNILTTWWIKNASFGGAAMAILANSLLMSFTFQAFHIIKKRISTFNIQHSTFFLIPIWISFEYLHLDWDLTWPWLTLGNIFAAQHTWIQWYEFTGVFGGSLWILLVNILLFEFILHYELQNKKLSIKQLIIALFLIIIPIFFSVLLYNSVQTTLSNKANVVVIQPNIDPYNEKFVDPQSVQIEKMLALAETLVDSTTDFLVLPETALIENIWENNINETESITQLQLFAKKFGKLSIVTGASTLRAFEDGEKVSETARKFSDVDKYYDSYNTALLIDSSKHVQIYHKSKLVPGVEKMPFPWIFKHIEKFAIDLGGTAGSLGVQKERTVLYSKDSIGVAPVICYESIYGEYVSDYVKNGANAIFIITNDGWWGDTHGYKQHLIYGRLRAIETRREIARSANTGISCTINERGDVENKTEWWQPTAFKTTINLHLEKTFYTRFGDAIAAVCLVFTSILSIAAFVLRFIKKK